jgi:hypothetical protein
VNREYALDADSVRDFSHGKRGAVAAARHADDNTLEYLRSLFFALDDLDMNAHGFAGPNGRHLLFRLLAFNLADDIHDSLLSIANVPANDPK